MQVFLHDKDGFWTCPFEGTIIFDEERSMSHLWHKEWRVVKWRRWKNMQKWANVSEPLGKINQMKFWPTSFWQLCMQPACILHAHLSRLSFSELDWFWWRVFCTHIIWVFSNHQLTSACIIFIMKSRMCANCQDCVLCMQSQSPSDMWTTRPPTLCRFFYEKEEVLVCGYCSWESCAQCQYWVSMFYNEYL